MDNELVNRIRQLLARITQRPAHKPQVKSLGPFAVYHPSRKTRVHKTK